MSFRPSRRFGKRFVASEATEFRRLAVGGENRWIDPFVDGPVSFLYVDEPAWHGGEPVWANLFWNRSIFKVYALPGSHIFGPIPWTPVVLSADGRLLLPDGGRAPSGDLVASNTMTFFGDQLSQGSSFALWRLNGAARLSTRVTGVRLQTGDIDASAQMDAYACDRGALALRLVAPGERTIVLSRDGIKYGTIRLEAGKPWVGTVPPAAGKEAHCTFQLLTVGGGVHADRFDFVRPQS